MSLFVKSTDCATLERANPSAAAESKGRLCAGSIRCIMGGNGKGVFKGGVTSADWCVIMSRVGQDHPDWMGAG
jgi:hypothetical protein